MFDETFRVCFADTQFGVALHQRIRFQVYRLDKEYTFPGKDGDYRGIFSAEKETDAWDHRSAHFIVQNRQTQQWVAATRLVLPGKDNRLPVDAISGLDRSLLPDPEMQLGEISRFCVIGNRSKGVLEPNSLPEEDSLESWGIGPVGKHQQFEVTLGMMRAVGIFALKRNMGNCVLMVTDAFARVLRTLGVTLIQVGPPTEYLGMRTTYLVDMRDAVKSMARKSSQVSAMFKRARHAYVRISRVAAEDMVDTVSEFSPDHSLFNETIFHETILQPADNDSELERSRKKTT
jgi:N-acyl amino acid synthase of PEP-CTERM/exosortase system